MTTTTNDIAVYWANVCILKRMEAEIMETATGQWSQRTDLGARMVYLGDTEDVRMYDQVRADLAAGKLGFDMLVTSRFDIFCSQTYLQSVKDQLHPVGTALPVRTEIDAAGVRDPDGLFYPVVVLPHFIVCNTSMVASSDQPQSLEDLLHPQWEGKVMIGSPDLPSGKFILFTMWHLFGDEGLKHCLKNWRQGSAPSAARHAVVKGECPIAILPGVFSGPGPQDSIVSIQPREGVPVLPSFAAVRKSERSDQVLDLLQNSVGSKALVEMYREQALAYPTNPAIATSDLSLSKAKLLFPEWEWARNQDMERFDELCQTMRT